MADGLEGRFPADGFEVLGEGAGWHESQHVGLEAFAAGAVERLDGGFLDGAVHTFGLAVGPRVAWLGALVLDAVLVAGAAWAAKGGSVWIARDLGYRGGRQTRLPLTDRVHLRHFSEARGGLSLRKATAGPAIGERTAAVI